MGVPSCIQFQIAFGLQMEEAVGEFNPLSIQWWLLAVVFPIVLGWVVTWTAEPIRRWWTNRSTTRKAQWAREVGIAAKDEHLQLVFAIRALRLRSRLPWHVVFGAVFAFPLWAAMQGSRPPLWILVGTGLAFVLQLIGGVKALFLAERMEALIDAAMLNRGVKQ